MKVLHVLNGAIGGASISTLELIDALSKRGVQSFIYCSARVSRAARKDLEARSKVPVFFGPLYFWNLRTRKSFLVRPLIEIYQVFYTGFLVKSSSKIMEVCQRLGIDIIHSSTALSPDGAVAAARLNTPHVWHVREMIGPGQLHRLKGDADGNAALRLLRSGFLVANSLSSYRAVMANIKSEKSAIIHNGFNFSGNSICHPGPFEAGSKVFGMVANISSTWKRHDVYIKAASIVASACPEAIFLLYGEIPGDNSSQESKRYYKYLIGLVRELGLQDRFVFKGYCKNVVDIMNSVDVIVHPCESESFGRVFVEASAAGRALVAARGGAAVEVISDEVTGILVEANDVSGFSSAMLRLIEDPTLARRLGAAARDHVLQAYEIDSCCEKICDLYSKIHMMRKAHSETMSAFGAIKFVLH